MTCERTCKITDNQLSVLAGQTLAGIEIKVCAYVLTHSYSAGCTSQDSAPLSSRRSSSKITCPLPEAPSLAFEPSAWMMSKPRWKDYVAGQRGPSG
jgi:hypothetical protein